MGGRAWNLELAVSWGSVGVGIEGSNSGDPGLLVSSGAL